eukprot:3932965-Rhodomonas_salina.2
MLIQSWAMVGGSAELSLAGCEWRVAARGSRVVDFARTTFDPISSLGQLVGYTTAGSLKYGLYEVFKPITFDGTFSSPLSLSQPHVSEQELKFWVGIRRNVLFSSTL